MNQAQGVGDQVASKRTAVASQLEDLIIEFGLRIVNGNTRSDLPPCPTLKRGVSTSYIDYIFLDQALRSVLEDMVIIPRSDSDHQALCARFDTALFISATLAPRTFSSSIETVSNRRNIKWAEVSSNLVLQRQIYETLIYTFSAYDVPVSLNWQFDFVTAHCQFMD